MAAKNTQKFETLSQKAKKKKDFIVVTLIFSIFSFLAISLGLAFLDTDKQEVFEKRKSVEQDKGFSIVKEQDFKENWAIAMENRIEKQANEMIQFKTDIKEENKKTLGEIKNLLIESTATQNKRIEEFGNQLTSQIGDLKSNVESRFSEQQNQIEDLSLRNNNDSSSDDGMIQESDDIVLGQDLLPPLSDDVAINISGKVANPTNTGKKVDPIDSVLDSLATDLPSENKGGDKIVKKEDAPVKKKKEYVRPKVVLKMVEVDTTVIQEEIKEEEKLMAELKRINQNNNFHLMTGLTQAYMVTGAYAPAFDSGQEEPLPVLLQAEGDILIANDDTQTIDKCLLIGSAKGNMNSQTADIRLAKISCSLGEGTKKIEGSISGWVIGENGIPGVPGELLHKNGAWLSKTFVSGFLQTFSSALGSTDSTQINIGSDTTDAVPIGTAVSDNAKSAAAGGLSTVFGKLGDYYLKMAEQIFPVIEVKGGRTVNILLKGGEDFTVTDFNKLDLDAISDTIEEENDFADKVGREEYIKMKQNLEATQEDTQSQNAPLIPPEAKNILEGRN